MLRSSIAARIPDGLPRGIALETLVGKPTASRAAAATMVTIVIKRLRMALLLAFDLARAAHRLRIPRGGPHSASGATGGAKMSPRTSALSRDRGPPREERRARRA